MSCVPNKYNINILTHHKTKFKLNVITVKKMLLTIIFYLVISIKYDSIKMIMNYEQKSIIHFIIYYKINIIILIKYLSKAIKK